MTDKICIVIIFKMYNIEKEAWKLTCFESLMTLDMRPRILSSTHYNATFHKNKLNPLLMLVKHLSRKIVRLQMMEETRKLSSIRHQSQVNHDS